MDLSKHWTLGKIAEACNGRLIDADARRPVKSLSIDSRRIKKGELFWVIEGASKDGNDFVAEAAKRGAMAAVVSRDVFPGLPDPYPLIRVSNGLKALGRLAEEHRLLFPKAGVIAITGSNGKTSTKEMVARVLSEAGSVTLSPGNYNNEVGCPLSVLELGSHHAFAVWEMAARKKGDIAYLSLIAHPNVVILTNIGTAHLETFGSEQVIFETKFEILRGLMPKGTVVYWAEDPWLTELPKRRPQNKYLTFGLGPTADVFGQVEEQSPDGTLVDIFYEGKKQGSVLLKVLGGGQVRNALAAFACGIALGVPVRKILKALEGFEPAPMRGERLTLGGKLFADRYVLINDAYNANPASMTDSALAFMRAYQGWTKILVLGEMRELGQRSGELHGQVGAAIAEAAQAEGLLDDRTYFLIIGTPLTLPLAEALKNKAHGGFCVNSGRRKTSSASSRGTNIT